MKRSAQTLITVALMICAFLIATIILARAGENVCAQYERQKQDLAQCLKKHPDGTGCEELSDLDWSAEEVAACKSKPIAKPSFRNLPPEYDACHGGNRAACKRWRVRACRDGNPAACDYDEAQKQSNPMDWCGQRYGNIPSQYRFCLNGSPDR